jgi:hypothetical protein
MKLKDLPQERLDLAIQRCKEYIENTGGDFDDFEITLEDDLLSAFVFGNTPEGHDFWDSVNNGTKKTII